MTAQDSPVGPQPTDPPAADSMSAPPTVTASPSAATAAPAARTVSDRQPRIGRALGMLLVGLLVVGGVYFFAVRESRPTVAFVTSGEGPYWDPVIEGARAAAREFNVDLRVERVKSDPFVQADVIRRLQSDRPDGVAISPLNASIQANLLADLASTTTMVTMDSDSPVTRRLCFVGTDNYAAGREGGEKLKEALPDGGAVIVCLGNLDKENTQRRRQGVIDELLGRPYQPPQAIDTFAEDQPIKGEKYTVVATLADGGDPAKATELAAEALKKFPDVRAFVGLLSYSAPAVLQALGPAGKLGQVKVIGFDVDERTLAGVEAGHVHATIMQDQYGQGYHAVRILADDLRGVQGGLPLFQMHSLPYRAVTRDNLADARRMPTGGMSAPAAGGEAAPAGDEPPPAAPPTTAPAGVAQGT